MAWTFDHIWVVVITESKHILFVFNLTDKIEGIWKIHKVIFEVNLREKKCRFCLTYYLPYSFSMHSQAPVSRTEFICIPFWIKMISYVYVLSYYLIVYQ